MQPALNYFGSYMRIVDMECVIAQGVHLRFSACSSRWRPRACATACPRLRRGLFRPEPITAPAWRASGRGVRRGVADERGEACAAPGDGIPRGRAGVCEDTVKRPMAFCDFVRPRIVEWKCEAGHCIFNNACAWGACHRLLAPETGRSSTRHLQHLAVR